MKVPRGKNISKDLAMGREPSRDRFNRWFTATLLSAGIMLSACDMARSPGQDLQPIPDASTTQPCDTIVHDRAVNPSTAQHQEQTYCDGVLELEVSTFTPPLDDGLHRQYVWLGDTKLSIISAQPSVVLLANEDGRYTIPKGQAVQLLGGLYTLSIDDVDGLGPYAYIPVKNGEAVLANDYLVRMDRSFYSFTSGDGTALMLDIYGSSGDPPTADISVFRGISQSGAIMGYPWINTETIVFLLDGYKIDTPEGRFSIEAAWDGDGLAGWTLSRTGGGGDR